MECLNSEQTGSYNGLPQAVYQCLSLSTRVCSNFKENPCKVWEITRPLRFFSAFKTSKENCLKQILKTKDVKNIHYNEHIRSYSFRIETLVFFTKFNSSYFYFETPDSI